MPPGPSCEKTTSGLGNPEPATWAARSKLAPPAHSPIQRPWRGHHWSPYGSESLRGHTHDTSSNVEHRIRQQVWHILTVGISHQTTGLAYPHCWNIASDNRFGASSPLELPKAEVVRHFPTCGSRYFRTRFEEPTPWSLTNEKS